MKRKKILEKAMAAAAKASGLDLVPAEIADKVYRHAVENRGTKKDKLPNLVGKKVLDLLSDTPSHTLFMDWPENIRTYVSTFTAIVDALEDDAEDELPPQE